MTAEAMFRVWRRVLADERLSRAAAEGALAERAAELGLSPNELPIAAELLRDGAAAYWPIAGYRFRIVDYTRDVLPSEAPFTAAVLRAAGHDLQRLAEQYLEVTGYRDYGPYMIAACRAFLDHLLGRDEVMARPGLRDVALLDRAIGELKERLAALPAADWRAPSDSNTIADVAIAALDAHDQQREQPRYLRRPNATLVTTARDILPLLQDADEAAALLPDARPIHVLAHLADEHSDVELSLLSDAACALYRAMEAPLSLAQAIALAGDEASARSALQRLLNLGVIAAATGATTATTDAATASPPTLRIIYGRHWNEVAAVRASTASSCSEQLFATVIDACGPLDGRRVLDVGCGGGHAAIRLAERGARVTGIDIAETSVQLARDYVAQTAPQLSPRIAFEVMDAMALAAPDDSFDAVTCIKTLWCIPGIAEAIAEMGRALRPGGRAVLQLWGAIERCDLITRSATRLQQKLDDVEVPASYTNQFALSAETVRGHLLAAHFAADSITIARHGAEARFASAAEYWDTLRTLAGTAYFNYARRSPAVRAAIDEQWRMDTADAVGADGKVRLSIEWLVVTATRATAQSTTNNLAPPGERER